MTAYSCIAPALAENLSTPEDLLICLAGTHDECVQLALIKARRCRPLSLPLATVLSDSLHPKVRSELAICAYLPDKIIVKLAADPARRVRLHVVIRSEEIFVPVPRYTPDEAYAILARDEDPLIQDELLGNRDVPVHIKRELARHERLRDEVWLRHGEDAQAQAAYQRMLTSSDSRHRRWALLSDRFRPPAQLVPELLADEKNRLEAIRRIPLSGELARSLVAEDDPHVRQAVASNPDLPRNLLDVLAADADHDVRWALIHRPHIPLDLLDAIDYQLDSGTRTYPVDWLWKQRHDRALVARYARSRQAVYRRTVAWMPGLDVDLVQQLATDTDYAVRLMLTEHNTDHVPVELLVEMLLTWTGFSSYELVRNPRVPDDVIDRLSRSEQARHRWLAHYSGRLTQQQRARLADDPDQMLATAVNPAPPPTLAQLREQLNDPSPEVRGAAARHPNLPVELMHELWQQASTATGTCE